MARPLRVLLIEDDADDRSAVLRDLQRAGFAPDVERVQDPEGMAAALRRGGFEVVIAQYRQPRFSAPEALRLWKQGGFEVPFLVYSDSIGAPQAVELLKGGASDLILKDDLARLGAAIERELREVEDRRARR